ETANGFAADIQRYLHDEPVRACPPSVGYRLGKFVRRNKVPGLATSLLLLTLGGGIIGTTLGLIKAERARQGESEQRRIAQDNEHKALAAAEAEKKAKDTAEAREADAKAVLDFVENKVFAAARPKNQEGGQGFDVKLVDAVKAALPFVDKGFTK